MDKDLILIGKISKPHGIKGGLRVISYAQSPDIYREIPLIHLKSKDNQIKSMNISAVSASGGAVILYFDGINNRNSTEALIGSELYIERSFMPEPSEDEYYHIDIMGLEVLTVDGITIGKVCEIIQTGGNDVFVVRGTEGERLVPATKEVISKIAISEGKILIKSTEGIV